ETPAGFGTQPTFRFRVIVKQIAGDGGFIPVGMRGPGNKRVSSRHIPFASRHCCDAHRRQVQPASTIYRDMKTTTLRTMFEVEGSRKCPDARCSLENGAAMLPLEPGENEIAVALANSFFGWGLMLRVAEPEGVQLAPK